MDPKLSRSGETSQAAITIAKEFFINSDDKQLPVTIGQTELDFGSCSTMRASESRTVTVTNNTNSKVCCSWKIPLSDDDDATPDFAVTPSATDIGAGRTAEFKVAFRPSQD